MHKELESAEAFGVWAATYDEECSKEVEVFSAITHDEVLTTLMSVADVQTGDTILDVGTGRYKKKLTYAQLLKRVEMHLHQEGPVI